MDRKEIHFEIGRDGGVSFTVKGVKGKGCEKVSDALKGLGQTETSRPTPEYYDEAKTRLHVETDTGTA